MVCGVGMCTLVFTRVMEVCGVDVYFNLLSSVGDLRSSVNIFCMCSVVYFRMPFVCLAVYVLRCSLGTLWGILFLLLFRRMCMLLEESHCLVIVALTPYL